MTLLLFLTSKVLAFEVIYNEFDNLNMWQERSISFYYSHDGAPENISEAEAIEAIEASAAEWSLIDGTEIELVLEDRVEPEPADRDDNFNVIFWDPAWNEADGDILALTGLWANEGGTIRGFDMRLREDKPWAIGSVEGAYDFQNAMAHELGHALGLQHPDVDEATMFAYTDPGEISKRDLHWDDEEGIRYLYAPVEAKSIFGCSTLPAPLSGAYGLPLIGIALLRRREQALD